MVLTSAAGTPRAAVSESWDIGPGPGRRG